MSASNSHSNSGLAANIVSHLTRVSPRPKEPFAAKSSNALECSWSQGDASKRLLHRVLQAGSRAALQLDAHAASPSIMQIHSSNQVGPGIRNPEALLSCTAVATRLLESLLACSRDGRPCRLLAALSRIAVSAKHRRRPLSGQGTVRERQPRWCVRRQGAARKARAARQPSGSRHPAG